MIADLRELAERTGDSEGAQRLCWGEGWRTAREFLRELLAEIDLEPEIDEAGNAWAYLPGEQEPALAVGSHLDSVPNGGWLDGALGVMGALGVLRAWATSGASPPRTLALVDWADEEGARFGRSLFGSSAVAGTFDPAELSGARDADGRRAPGVLAENGVELDRVLESRSRLERIGSYLELHIEQGPVLEAERIKAAAVSGCVGVERLRFLIRGRVSHAGTTPMDARHDAGLAAAAAALRIEEIAIRENGVGTVGEMTFEPGIPTAVPGRASMVVDLRNRDADALARMLTSAREAGRRLRGGAGLRVERGARLADRADRLRPRAGGTRAGGVRAGHRHRLRAAQRRPPRRRLDGAARPDGDGLLSLDRRGQPRTRGGHRGAGSAGGD